MNNPDTPEESAADRDTRLKRSREDEKLSRDLAAFIQQEAAYEALAPHIKGIGNYLNANGGHSRMQNVYDQVKPLGGDPRLLDLSWKGIGKWQG